jgi:hypothetical protein
VAGFASPESCAVDAFVEQYTRAENAPSVDTARALRDRLAQVGAI